ncbi:MAG: hypothetical protein ACX94C_02220 [Phycisphaerales bacterium]
MKTSRTASLITRSARPMQALVLALGVSLAGAQPVSDLPRSTIETISVNSGQRSQIQQFVQNWSQRLQSDSASDNQRALEALTEPLHNRGVSIAFRQAYAQMLIPVADELIGADTVKGKLNALRLLGDLATPSAAQRIRTLLDDQDAGVRLFAVASTGRVFLSTSVHGPAMAESDTIAMIDAIAEIAESNMDDEEFTRACARALAQGTSIGTRDLPNTRSRAIIALSDLVSTHIESLDEDENADFALSLALDAASSTTQSISDISSTVNADAARAAVRLGAEIVSLPLRRVIAKTIEPQGERERMARSVQAGETLLYFARRKAAEIAGRGVNGIETTSFSTQLESGDDRDFRNEAATLVGPGGPIVSQFNFDDDEFLN